MTASLYFAGTNTTDREERIEEDLLREALAREIPELQPVVDTTQFPAGSFVLGRLGWQQILMAELAFPRLEHLKCDYWRWDVFLETCRRQFCLCTYEEACREVARLHSMGQGAFVKATDDKLLAIHIADGQTLQESLGDMAYSFLDRPACLMVQSRAKIEYEYRLLIIDGEIVTGAGQIPQHTPLDNETAFDPKVQPRIGHSAVERRPELVHAYLEFAKGVIPRLAQQSLSLDLAIINDEIGIVECNAMLPGRIGLFASDVSAFARAVAGSEALKSRLATTPQP